MHGPPGTPWFGSWSPGRGSLIHHSHLSTLLSAKGRTREQWLRLVAQQWPSLGSGASASASPFATSLAAPWRRVVIRRPPRQLRCLVRGEKGSVSSYFVPPWTFGPARILESSTLRPCSYVLLRTAWCRAPFPGGLDAPRSHPSTAPLPRPRSSRPARDWVVSITLTTVRYR